MDRPSPRSLILDLLSTLRHGSMPVAALVEAAELFEIPGGSLRVALARLRAAGLVTRDSRGRYAPGPQGTALQGLVRSWRRMESRMKAWDGSWLGVHLPASGGRAERDFSRRATRRLGFRELHPGLQLRPANLRGGTRGARKALYPLGLAPSALVFRLRDLELATDAKARQSWDVAALEARYHSSQIALARSTRRLASAPAERRMVESFLLGGSVIQQLVADPLLPEEILPGNGRRALLESMRDYDRLGRSCWGSLLARHGVPHRSAPLDTRLLDPGATLPSTGGHPQ